MTCFCQKGKTCPDCLAAADLALEPGRVSSPAFYEERIRLLTEENARLRARLQRLAHPAQRGFVHDSLMTVRAYARAAVGGEL